MKNYSLISFLLFTHLIFAQSNSEIFTVSEDIRTQGKTIYERGTFATVASTAILEVENKSADELYDLSLNWIQETYKNPDEVLKGSIKGEYIRWTGMSDFKLAIEALGTVTYLDVKWTIEIRFKDGRVKWDFINIEAYSTPSQYSSGGWYSIPLVFRYKNHKDKIKKYDLQNLQNFRSSATLIANEYLNYLKNGGSLNNPSDDEW